MARFIIIFYTEIHDRGVSEMVITLLNAIATISECTIDLSDTDKVLRIASKENVSDQVQQQLLSIGIPTTVTAIYTDHP